MYINVYCFPHTILAAGLFSRYILTNFCFNTFYIRSVWEQPDHCCIQGKPTEIDLHMWLVDWLNKIITLLDQFNTPNIKSVFQDCFCSRWIEELLQSTWARSHIIHTHSPLYYLYYFQWSNLSFFININIDSRFC